MGQDSALQKPFELVFHKLGQACSGLQLDLGKKGLDVFLDHLIQRGLVGASVFVGGPRTTWRRLPGCPVNDRRHHQVAVQDQERLLQEFYRQVGEGLEATFTENCFS